MAGSHSSSAGLITIAASLIVIQVMKKHPEGTLFDLLTRYLGKWAGKAGAIFFALYLFYYAYTGTRSGGFDYEGMAFAANFGIYQSCCYCSFPLM